MATLSFKPKQVTKRMLSDLNERAFEVLANRFGLTDDAERRTLESIGNEYGITRERVRQIENAALNTIKKSDSFGKEHGVFGELKDFIHSLGAIVAEDELLSHVSDDPCVQNHIHLYLVLGDHFSKHKENDHFKTRWSVDDEIMDKVHDALKKLYSSLGSDDIISEGEMIERFLNQLKDVSNKYMNEEIARRWLGISKMIDQNPLGEWGKATSSNIRTRGVKDYAYLMMRQHGSPMHFREVAKAISDTFGKKTHHATCHNELIKDGRFVLVGRGIYALKDWGYKSGIVRDVIRDILKEEGPLSKEGIIDRVLKERYLKRNTILVNLQNTKHFKKTKDGLYSSVK